MRPHLLFGLPLHRAMSKQGWLDLACRMRLYGLGLGRYVVCVIVMDPAKAGAKASRPDGSGGGKSGTSSTSASRPSTERGAQELGRQLEEIGLRLARIEREIASARPKAGG